VPPAPGTVSAEILDPDPGVPLLARPAVAPNP